MAKINWTPELRRVYSRFPSAIRSSKWLEIMKLANAGKFSKAVEICRELEKSSIQHRAQNVMARKIRIERVQLFKDQRVTLSKLRATYVATALDLGRFARRAGLLNVERLIKFLNSRMGVLRMEERKILHDSIYSSLRLGLKNTVDAVHPILKDNQESRIIREERLSFGLDVHGNSSAKVARDSSTWGTIIDKSYRQLTQQSLGGLTPSQRIWDNSEAARRALERLIRNGVANGDSAYTVSKRLEDFLQPGIEAGIDNPGTGVYANPYKNAARLARTEMNAAYTMAQTEWAGTRSWIESMMVTLSPAHDKEDDCDDLAGATYTPDEAADVLPIHPHCMCFWTYVIPDELLAPSDQPSEESIHATI